MTSLREIDEYLQSCPPEELASSIRSFRNDGRSGVQKLLDKYERRLEAFRKELQRLDGMMFFERKYAEFELIAGIYEAGRGPLAGPVVAAAVILQSWLDGHPGGGLAAWEEDEHALDP